MTNIGSKIKEGAGFVEEEIGEAVGNKKMANKGRALRNEGLIEQGEPAKLTKPGTTA